MEAFTKRGGIGVGKKVLTLVFLGLLMILTACGFSKETSGSKQPEGEKEGENAQPKVLHVVAEDNISSLDQAVGHDSTSNVAMFNSMESLYSLGKDGNPELTGATEHNVSEDGLTHTFKIRDTKWSNGDPVTAFDYEYTLKRAFDVTSFHLHIYKTAKILNADEILEGQLPAEEFGVKALDEKTLEIKLSGANPLFSKHLTSTAFLPVNQKYVEEQGSKYGTESNLVVYNGAFLIEDWVQDQGWTFVKNPDYWNADQVKIDKVVVKIVKEESTAVNLYDTDKVDVISISAANIDKYKNDTGYQTIATSGIKFIRFNHTHEALKNVNIRKALDMSWDKEALVDVILKNGSQAAYYLVPDTAKKASGETFRSLSKDFKVSKEEAVELWKTGLSEIGNQKIELTVLAYDDTESRATAEYIQNQWQSNLPGLEVKILVQPKAQAQELEKSGKYEVSLSGAGMLTTDPSNYLRMFLTGDNFNRMDYSNEKYDELFELASSELDEDKRFDLLLEAERILIEDDAAFGSMYQNANAIVHKEHVKDVVHNATIPQFTYKWAYIE